MNLSTVFSTLAAILSLTALGIALATQTNHQTTGRFQAQSLDRGYFVVVDTSTGALVSAYRIADGGDAFKQIGFEQLPPRVNPLLRIPAATNP